MAASSRRQIPLSADDSDAFGARALLCVFSRAGVAKKSKRSYRQRERARLRAHDRREASQAIAERTAT